MEKSVRKSFAFKRKFSREGNLTRILTFEEVWWCATWRPEYACTNAMENCFEKERLMAFCDGAFPLWFLYTVNVLKIFVTMVLHAFKCFKFRIILKIVIKWQMIVFFCFFCNCEWNFFKFKSLVCVLLPSLAE